MFDRNQQSPSPTTAPAARRDALRTVRGIGRRAIVLGALVAALSAGTTSTAQAWGYEYARGSAGSVSLPRINASDIYMFVGGVSIANLVLDSAIGPLVYRSPATTGAQDVVALYSLERWNGSAWAVQAQGQAFGVIPAGYGSVRLARASFQPTSGKGYYRVRWAFGWNVHGTSSSLGTGVLGANSTSDFACITPLRLCQVTAGYIRVGALGGGW